LSSRELKKRASTKYAYYLQKLVEKQLVLSKRVGNALVVWPVHAEKYRTIHEILSER
jgi:predicted transcriptional regulator